MYSSIIRIKENVSGETLSELREIAEKAFSNRAGSVKNSGCESHCLIFRGGEKDYGCLDLGVAELGDMKRFVDQVDSWNWIDDEDPSESCDVLKIYAMPLR